MRNLTLFRCYRKVFSQLCPILVILLLISSIVPVSGLVSVLDYDANGNLVSDGRYAYTYDGFNQLIRINEGGLTGPTVAEYTYGPDKERIKKVEYNNGTATTSYYPSKDVIYTENSTGISATTYYYDDYALVARKDPNGKNYFYHPNHLGSTDIVTNETGAVVEDIDYLPFGETQDDDRFLFTGKEKDSESGLMYYGARYYNPSTMRFTQPDTMLPDIYDPQQLNRYAYARNNPQTYVDPSGHFIDTLFDIGFIGWDIWNIIKSPRSRDNWVSLGLDTVGAFVPFATGLGAGYRVAKYGGKAAKLFERGKGASGVGKRIFESARAVKSAKADGKLLGSISKSKPEIRSISDKLERYSLNKAHPVGGNKATVFESALGFNKNNANQLTNQITKNFNPL